MVRVTPVPSEAPAMHPFFYGDIASQHRDELVAAARHHRLRRLFRRRPVIGVTAIPRRAASPARTSRAADIDAAA